MAIVHVHVERTGGVSLQDLYEKKYPGPAMLWYSVRDKKFAPFNIKTANYTKDWQLRAYAFVARAFPIIRKSLLLVRALRRKHKAVAYKELATKAEMVIGHFSIDQVLPYLPTKEHSYRTVVREPLARMWSHYNHWRAHKGDVGHRVVPSFRPGISFEEFALLPEMQNYQVQAIGENLAIYDYIGITENLISFASETGLIDSSSYMPTVNHFGNKLPLLDTAFIDAFKKFHAGDYKIYEKALNMYNRSRKISQHV